MVTPKTPNKMETIKVKYADAYIALQIPFQTEKIKVPHPRFGYETSYIYHVPKNISLPTGKEFIFYGIGLTTALDKIIEALHRHGVKYILKTGYWALCPDGCRSHGTYNGRWLKEGDFCIKIMSGEEPEYAMWKEAEARYEAAVAKTKKVWNIIASKAIEISEAQIKRTFSDYNYMVEIEGGHVAEIPHADKGMNNDGKWLSRFAKAGSSCRYGLCSLKGFGRKPYVWADWTDYTYTGATFIRKEDIIEATKCLTEYEAKVFNDLASRL